MNVIAVLFALSLPLGFGIVMLLRNASSIKCDAFQAGYYRNSSHDYGYVDEEFELIMNDDVCLFHWVLDCSCFDEPVAVTEVHDPYEVVLPFRERIQPPDWVDGWVAPQVRYVVKPKVNK